MVKLDSHPTQDLLTAFAHGRLDADQLIEIESHIESCDSCCNFLKTVPPDGLLQNLNRNHDADTIPGSDLPTEIERRRKDYESDWRDGKPVDISDYLPDRQSAAFLPMLEELIQIDLEHRWGADSTDGAVSEASHPSGEPLMLESYLERFPQLREEEVLRRLIRSEIQARQGSSRPPSFEEYQERFPDIGLQMSTIQMGDEARTVRKTPAAMGIKEVEQFPRPFGNYSLLALLGRGGMGKVYKGRQDLTEREVAVKVTKIADFDPHARREVRERFEAEMRAAAAVTHDNVMPIFDVGEAGDCMYYTMPMVDGDLAMMVRRQPMEGKVAANYLAQAARGLAAAHDRGLLHRDIKPHNLMIDREKDRIFVADFGLARLASSQQQLTRDGAVIGTPAYMAPEQVRNAKGVDHRADVYALGATLYHLIVGRPPFNSASPVNTLRQVEEQDPVSPREMNPQIDRDLETICLRCLQKNPTHRFDTATDLAEDLDRYLRGEPIQSRPIGPVGRGLRWARRNPILAGMGLAVASLLVLVAVVAGAGWYSTRQQLNRVVATSKQGQAALNELFTFVRTEPLLNQPGHDVVRRQLLTRGVEHYQALLALAKENESLSSDLVAARVLLGLLTFELDGPEAAAKEFQLAIDTAKKLPKEQRDAADVQVALGDSWNGLGRAFHELGKYKEADEAFETAIEIRRTNAKSTEAVEEKRKLANAIMNRGLTLASKGKHQETRAAQEQAQKMRGDLLLTDDDIKLLRDFAKGQFNLARLELSNSEFESGLKRLRDATARFEKLTKKPRT